MERAPEIRIIAVRGLPEVTKGADLSELLLAALARRRMRLQDGDVLVFTSKIISKAEGRQVDLADVTPSRLATSFAREAQRDPRVAEVVLGETKRVVKMDRGILIAETAQGWVCAQAGVDASNVVGAETVALLPVDADRSARALGRAIRKKASARVAVIISDTFGRPWREGLTNVAIGISGMEPLRDYRGKKDGHGRELSTTVIAVADELAGAAELVMGKLARVPIALIRGFSYRKAKGTASALVRPAASDLFR